MAEQPLVEQEFTGLRWMAEELGEQKLKQLEWTSGEKLSEEERTTVKSYFVHWQRKIEEINRDYPINNGLYRSIETANRYRPFAMHSIRQDLITKTELLIGKERTCRLFGVTFDAVLGCYRPLNKDQDISQS